MILKRVFDVAVAATLVVLAAPVLTVVAIAVASTSPGGVLFCQERVGRHGKAFKMFKFRSMVADAAHVGPYFTSDGDPRITPVGRFIRRTSLDELPQIFNVLRGDMSLVGPRPDVPAQRSLYTEGEWLARHAVRPGITGLAQATMRSAASEEQRKALDLEYARSSSLILDIKILLLTARQVVLKGGN